MTSADGNLIFLPTIGILRFFPAPIHHAGDRDLFPDKCSKLKLCCCGGPSSLRATSGLAARKRDVRYRHRMSVLAGWSQPVAATLYLRGKRWSVGWNGDFIEVLLRQRRRSY